ncbi:Protein chain release factor A [Geosmithia morbida]|uniref:Protein chain release factor A n=1 Tax=Geosmithia morbida TaxID=1094350 RepID=A0A9P4YRM4_9HYPO|nr:Protein chain release factor A [Geosmithia morbida]KAF4120519.1 Protein chain release factor A [Geosmithia morbida]
MLRLLPQRFFRFQPRSLHRPLCTTPTLLSVRFPPRPKPPPDSEIEESYLKGSGPGGQKINKTNSAVQLRHTPTGIVVKSQATRSRSQNRKHARELLAQKVDELRNGLQSREAIVGRIRGKRIASADKKKRRKYRKLNGGQEQEQEQEQEHEQEQGGRDQQQQQQQQQGKKPSTESRGAAGAAQTGTSTRG